MVPLTNRKTSKEGWESDLHFDLEVGKKHRPSRGMEEEDIGRPASDLVSIDCQNSTGFWGFFWLINEIAFKYTSISICSPCCCLTTELWQLPGDFSQALERNTLLTGKPLH